MGDDAATVEQLRAELRQARNEHVALRVERERRDRALVEALEQQPATAGGRWQCGGQMPCYAASCRASRTRTAMTSPRAHSWPSAESEHVTYVRRPALSVTRARSVTGAVSGVGCR
jgi:hypothetical protein